MNRIKGFISPKTREDLLTYGISRYSALKKHKSCLLDVREVGSSQCRTEGAQTVVSVHQERLSYRPLDLGEHSMALRNRGCTSIVPCTYVGNSVVQKSYVMNFGRQYASSSENDPSLNREFLAQLWITDRKMKRPKAMRKQNTIKSVSHDERVFDSLSSLQQVIGKFFSSAPVTNEEPYDQKKSALEQPPPSQSMIGPLRPASPIEAQVAPLLARSNLLITRDIEWANLMLGFEQENRYGIVDVSFPGSPVGLIREQSNLIARQLLRKRRPFVAYITDALGNELFRVRRPFWWINSSIYAEINGKQVGVVHRRWHLWKRIYDLYLGNEQFAVVENPGFWNWTFTLKDIDGKVLAGIDRDWRGFGFEVFTDAGQYVIRFGKSDMGSNSGPDSMIEQLEVFRPLTLSERAVTVALAVSLDNDYFSRHGGWGMPFIGIED